MTSTLVGAAGLFALMIFIVAEGTIDPAAFVNVPALIIVVGGSLVALLISFRTAEVARAWRSAKAVFRDVKGLDGEIAALVAFAAARQRSDVREAERIAEGVRDPFLRLGLQLVLDDTPLADIHHVLAWRIQTLTEIEMSQARIFRSLSDFAPALGLLGTIIGLIGLLGGLGTQPIDVIGKQMSIAFTTTLYGVLLANLLFRPMAIKLEQRIQVRVQMMNVLVEGVVLARLGRSPVMLRETMAGFAAGIDENADG